MVKRARAKMKLFGEKYRENRDWFEENELKWRKRQKHNDNEASRIKCWECRTKHEKSAEEKAAWQAREVER
jgi:hypothetical protein